VAGGHGWAPAPGLGRAPIYPFPARRNRRHPHDRSHRTDREGRKVAAAGTARPGRL